MDEKQEDVFTVRAYTLAELTEIEGVSYTTIVKRRDAGYYVRVSIRRMVRRVERVTYRYLSSEDSLHVRAVLAAIKNESTL